MKEIDKEEQSLSNCPKIPFIEIEAINKEVGLC